MYSSCHIVSQCPGPQTWQCYQREALPLSPPPTHHRRHKTQRLHCLHVPVCRMTSEQPHAYMAGNLTLVIISLMFQHHEMTPFIWQVFPPQKLIHLFSCFSISLAFILFFISLGPGLGGDCFL